MRRMIALSALVISACGGTAATTTSSQPSVTAGATTTGVAGIAPCLAGDRGFSPPGALDVFGGPGGDARQVAEVRWAPYAGCERVEIYLVTADGAPATAVGPTSIEPRLDGIVRITLPELVTLTAVADTSFAGNLVQKAYVVRARGGGLFVDLHLAAPANVRAGTLDTPARVVVDVQPGTVAPTEIAIADNIVLTAPSAGPAEYPLVIGGYSRTFEATVVARLRAPNTTTIEAFTTATDYLDAWGEFEMELADGPSGSVALFVGEDRATDGTEHGVTVNLTLP